MSSTVTPWLRAGGRGAGVRQRFSLRAWGALGGLGASGDVAHRRPSAASIISTQLPWVYEVSKWRSTTLLGGAEARRALCKPIRAYPCSAENTAGMRRNARLEISAVAAQRRHTGAEPHSAENNRRRAVSDARDTGRIKWVPDQQRHGVPSARRCPE